MVSEYDKNFKSAQKQHYLKKDHQKNNLQKQQKNAEENLFVFFNIFMPKLSTSRNFELKKKVYMSDH